MPTMWTHSRIRLPWGRLSVYVAGEGPPLLLLHGLGGSGRYWAGIRQPLAPRRLLIAPDLPGFGLSDKPPVAYSRDFHVEALRRLLDAMRIAGLIDIAGHSMGGILGALLAARRPEHVASLALVASPFPRPRLRPHRMPHGAVRLTAYRALQRILPVISPVVRSATFPRAVIADYLRHTVDSYQRTSNALIWDPTLTDELAGLGAALGHRPQLLLYSDQDATIAPDSLLRWRATLPAAEVKIIAGAHQLLLRDHFATLAAWYPAGGGGRAL
jgi:3-oxoadipate enol-lactonase